MRDTLKSSSSPNPKTGLTVLFALLLGVSALLTGCPEEEQTGTGAFQISVAAVPSRGEVRGAPLNISITIQQPNGAPLASGSIVDILEFGCLTGDPTVGRFGTQPEDAACGQVMETVTGINGAVSAQFHCLREGTSTLIAAPSGAVDVSGSTSVTCTPGPSGDWNVTTIERTEGTLETGSKRVVLTATAVQGDGTTPATAGTQLRAVVENGEDVLKLSGGNQGTTNDQGQVNFEFLTQSVEGNALVKVEFVDDRFGMAGSESFRVRPPSLNSDTLLEVAVRRGNLVVEGEERSVQADGQDFLTIEAELVPPPGAEFSIAGQPVTLTVLNDVGYFNDNENTREIQVVTDENGKASVTFHGGLEAGTSNVTVSVVDPNPEASVPDAELTESVTLNVTSIGAISFESATPTAIYVRGSGLEESTEVVFQVKDTKNQPMRGVEVSLTLPISAPQGVELTRALVITDDEGFVRTTATSGFSVGVFNVIARATFGDAEPLEAPSRDIPVVGAKATRKGWILNCEFKNIGGFIGAEGDNLNNPDTFACLTELRDRSGNPVGVLKNVFFKSEGGSVDSPRTSVVWDIVNQPSSPPSDTGKVVTVYSSNGEPPCDVDPDEDAQEPFMMFDGDNTRICPRFLSNCPDRELDDCSANPRDGLSTILGFTTGEEGFTDVNRNGTFDPGEPFVDLSEPFIDTNDNNRYDINEDFEDFDEDETFDGPNGQWDSETLIWLQTRVLLTGSPTVQSTSNAFQATPGREVGYFFRSDDPTTPIPVGGVVRLNPGVPGGMTLGYTFVDQHLNPLNPSARYSKRFVGTVEGLSIVDVDPNDPADTYGFDVAYSNAQLDVDLIPDLTPEERDLLDGTVSTPIISLNWAPGNSHFFGRGYMYKALIDITNEVFDTAFSMVFAVDLKVCPSCSGTVTIEFPINVLIEGP